MHATHRLLLGRSFLLASAFLLPVAIVSTDASADQVVKLERLKLGQKLSIKETKATLRRLGYRGEIIEGDPIGAYRVVEVRSTGPWQQNTIIIGFCGETIVGINGNSYGKRNFERQYRYATNGLSVLGHRKPVVWMPESDKDGAGFLAQMWTPTDTCARRTAAVRFQYRPGTLTRPAKTLWYRYCTTNKGSRLCR